MPHPQGLHHVLGIAVSEGAPACLVYCEQITARLQHSCHFIFKHSLKINYRITSSLAEFESSDGLKVNYSATPLPQVVQIIPQLLLFEKGISETVPRPFLKNNRIWFFENGSGQDNVLHFDVFAAVFYFISRYEEWQSFAPDAHGRFELSTSLLFRHGQHLKPVVDGWVAELKELLGKCYSTPLPQAHFKAISSIDVDNLFAYRHKGFVRTAGACLKDLVKFDFKNLAGRLRTIAGRQRDPFDIYDDVAEFCKNHHVPLFWFFLFRSGTAYDRTVSPRSGAYKAVIKKLKNAGAFIGLHPSYYTVSQPAQLQKEIRDFSATSGSAVHLSRQHFLRFNIKTTPQALIQQGIAVDFTMGYASGAGFRAGTAQPFYYYDFLEEQTADLLFVPFCAMDGAYLVYRQVSAAEAEEELWQLALEVKKTGGVFMTVFHERTFFNHLYPGFGPLYKNLHQRLKDLRD